MRPALRTILLAKKPEDEEDVAAMSGIRIFVDYWNVEREISAAYGFSPTLRWRDIGQNIARFVSQRLERKPPLRFDGMQVYASFSTSPLDLKRRSYLEAELSFAPGSVLISEQRGAKKVRSKCANCGEVVAVDREKSVDVRLAVDVIKATSIADTEIIALVSADEDFVPLLEYVRFVGKKVFLVELPSTSQRMKSLAWGRLEWGNLHRLVERSALARACVLTDSSIEVDSEISALLNSPPDLVDVRDVRAKPLSPKEIEFLMKSGWPFEGKYERRGAEEVAAGIASGAIKFAGPIIIVGRQWNVPKTAEEYVAHLNEAVKIAQRGSDI